MVESSSRIRDHVRAALASKLADIVIGRDDIDLRCGQALRGYVKRVAGKSRGYLLARGSRQVQS